MLIFGHAPFEVAARDWVWINTKAIFSDAFGTVRFILTGFAVAFSWLASIAVHEFGHFFAGRAVGFRYKSMRIGRFHIDQSFHVVRKEPSNEECLGRVEFFPSGMEGRPWQYAFMIVAGPLTNLLAGFCVFLMPFHKSFVSGSFIGFCLYLGFANLTPLAPDGRRLFAILFRKQNHEAVIALSQIYDHLIETGKDYDELPAGLITRAAAIKEKSLRAFMAHHSSYVYSYGREHYEAAAASLEKCFELSPWAIDSLRQALPYSAVIIQAKRGRIEIAARWLSQYSETLELMYRLQAEGTILEASGDFDATLAKIAECEELLVKEPEGRNKDYIHRQLEKWKAKLKNRSAVTS